MNRSSNSANNRRANQRGSATSVVLFLIVIVAAGAAAWWYFAPDTLPTFVKHQLPVSARSNPTLYKWRDAKGNLHVTDAPPTDRPYEAVQYDPNTNVVPNVMPPGSKAH